MRYTLLFLLALLGSMCLASCQSQSPEYTNHLAGSTSPYLLQHAHNPVDWYPWGEEALAKAKAENKPIVISIGYAACHWCHVMEHESFEDTAVARVMNEHFVSIKIDREERPDIDQVYMNAAYLMNGSGGWPLNVLTLPDGRPFYAGTYFPKEQWTQLLNRTQDYWGQYPDSLVAYANALTQGIQGLAFEPLPNDGATLAPSTTDSVQQSIIAQVDFSRGGLQGSQKFPMPAVFTYLLHHNALTGNAESLNAATRTLDAMAKGGIYDHVGGGFARYSTDVFWKVPHFEKMLYDNAQLAQLYTKAHLHTGNAAYLQVVEETLGFVARELTHPEGGFYSSLDADSEGEEGKFYVWGYQEFIDVLGPERGKALARLYNVSEKGNWEGHNILHRTQEWEVVAAAVGMSAEELKALAQEAKPQLLEARTKRVRPGLDDKVLTSWNALMISAYAQAYAATRNTSYLNAAKRATRFVQTNLYTPEGALLRSYKDGRAEIGGFLDDYALMAQAYIDLYQATFEVKWLEEAKALADYALAHFYDDAQGMAWYTPNEAEALVTRPIEVADNVIPSSNAVLAQALHYLGLYWYNNEYLATARRMAGQLRTASTQYGNSHAHWGQLMLRLAYPTYEIAIVGPEVSAKQETLAGHYLPNAILLGAEEENGLELLANKAVPNKTLIYVCREKACQMPTPDVERAMGQLRF